MGNCSMTIHAVGSHHNTGLDHDINKMFARFVDELKAKGHSVTHAVLHHGGAEDMLDEKAPTRAGAYGALAIAATLPFVLAGALVLAAMGMGHAADLPAGKKAIPLRADPAPAASSPFYIGLTTGAGFANMQSDITAPGLATGTPKVWPAGFMVGGVAGYLSNTGPFSIGAEVEADYDFTHASVGCSGVIPCLGSARNSWFFAEKLIGGLTIAQVTGFIPASAQAANWPHPITVPASITSNVMILPEIGFAQRNVDLCALDLVTGNNLCGSQWKNGFLYGAQVRFAAAQNVDVRVEYNYIDFGHGQTFTPAQSVPLFANTVAAKDEQRVMFGFDYRL